MRGKLVVGNWKMNGGLASNRLLLQALLPALPEMAAVKSAVCVPFPYLAQVEELLQSSSIAWGAQDVCQFANGAYTGGVSAAMLAEFGCRYAIVGHSERRSLFGETDEIVARKFAAVLKAGITPLLCVGETLAEREAGVTEEIVARQLEAVIGHCGMKSVMQGVIAYEPVWAIGTGRTANPSQAQAVHAYIRQKLAVQDTEAAARVSVLYGGSVKAANAGELFRMPDIDGGLIGGASLDANEFIAICRAAHEAARAV